MNFDYPQWEEPGNGRRQECMWCGKHLLPAIHSCNRVPLTDAARQRAGLVEVCRSPAYLYAADIDGAIFYSCKECNFVREFESFAKFEDVKAADEEHRRGSRD